PHHRRPHRRRHVPQILSTLRRKKPPRLFHLLRHDRKPFPRRIPREEPHRIDSQLPLRRRPLHLVPSHGSRRRLRCPTSRKAFARTWPYALRHLSHHSHCRALPRPNSDSPKTCASRFFFLTLSQVPLNLDSSRFKAVIFDVDG